MEHFLVPWLPGTNVYNSKWLFCLCKVKVTIIENSSFMRLFFKSQLWTQSNPRGFLGGDSNEYIYHTSSKGESASGKLARVLAEPVRVCFQTGKILLFFVKMILQNQPENHKELARLKSTLLAVFLENIFCMILCIWEVACFSEILWMRCFVRDYLAENFLTRFMASIFWGLWTTFLMLWILNWSNSASCRI